MIRRTTLAVAGALAVASTVLAGCSTGSTETGDAPAAASTAEAGAFPVTIEHAYGSTTVKDEPTRIATIGWSDQDVLLSLGVVPVGAQQITWGGNQNESTDWFDEKLKELGGKQPTRYNADTTTPVKEISKLAPDLILATNSGISEADYKKLSQIAPTVAFPGDPWLTSWKDSLEMIGDATGRSEEADKVERETQAKIDSVATTYPELDETSFLVTGVQDNSKLGTIGLYGTGDARSQLLSEIGMKPAPAASTMVKKGEFYADVSAEKAPQLKSDVLVDLGYVPGSFEALQKDKLLSRIPAIKSDHYVDVTDQPLSLAFSAASPLSIPYFIDELVPSIAKAANGGRINVTP